MLEVSEIRDPATLTEDELRAEVWHWRHAAVQALGHFHQVAEAAGHNGAQQAIANARDAMSPWVAAFAGGATGEELEKCPLCSEPLIPGQPALRCVDQGDVHAECLGERIDGGEVARPGDRYQLDPDSVVDGDDEPIPDSDGVLVSYAAPPLFDPATAAAIINHFWRR